MQTASRTTLQRSLCALVLLSSVEDGLVQHADGVELTCWHWVKSKVVGACVDRINQQNHSS